MCEINTGNQKNKYILSSHLLTFERSLALHNSASGIIVSLFVDAAAGRLSLTAQVDI